MNRLVAIFCLCLLSTLAAQPRPTGTGEISGVVWSADQAPQPIRHAVVNLSGGGLPSVRSVVSDDAGRFSFARLPAGSYTIVAKKAAYLPAAYGSPKPGRTGSSVVLTAGQRAAVNITMFKGAVIAGQLRDGSGQPVSGVTVSAMDARGVTLGTTAVSLGTPIDSAVTDDRGMYRIYGLMPGEYLITALPSPGGSGDIGSRTVSEMDALLSTLTQRRNGALPGAPASGSAPPPIPLPPSVGYAKIYFPGTALYSEAAAVRVGAGEERDGVSFEVSRVPVASITGVVTGNIPNPAAVQLSLVIGGPIGGNISTMGITSTPPNTRGEFSYGNVPPGQYRIVAKVRRGATDALVNNSVSSSSSFGSSSGGGRGTPIAGGPPPPSVEQLFAIADVTIRGQDVTGVALSLHEGGTIAGALVFDAGTAPIPADLTSMRLSLSLQGGYTITQGTTMVGNGISSVTPAGVRADGTFQLISIGPSQYTLGFQAPAEVTNTWRLRSAMLDGRDLLDTPIEGPDINWRGVVVTLSDKHTELSGALQAGAGQPSDYFVVAFSTDRNTWRVGARRSVSTKPGTDGRFVFADLPAGEYYLAALTDLDPIDWQTPAFLEQVVPAAAKVMLREGEKKPQDLRIR